MTAVSARGHRTPLTFSVEGLPAREELLLKSLVRLLDHRTNQSWSWKGDHADLRVVAEGTTPPPDDATRKVVPTVIVSQGDLPQGHFLRLPLHTDELERVLNRLGTLIMHARGLGLATVTEPAEEEFRLLRWPPATLLDSPMRVRMATILASRPATLSTLQQRSTGSAAECVEFLEQLQRAGLVEGRTPVTHPTVRSLESVLADAVPSGPTPLREPVQPGLLARIRSRLGLVSTGAR